MRMKEEKRFPESLRRKESKGPPLVQKSQGPLLIMCRVSWSGEDSPVPSPLLGIPVLWSGGGLGTCFS